MTNPPLHNVLQLAAERQAKIKADAAQKSRLDEIDRFGVVDLAEFRLSEIGRDDLLALFRESRQRLDAALAAGRRTLGIERLTAKISAELFRRRLEGDDSPLDEDELAV